MSKKQREVTDEEAIEWELQRRKEREKLKPRETPQTKRIVVDLPESVHAALTERAKDNERSLAGEIRIVLRDAAKEWTEGQE